jgi:hypothetical protein
MLTRYYRGDLAGFEKHFAAWLTFFGDPGFKQSRLVTVNAYAFAGYNAWLLGQADVARQRQAQMMAAATGSNPFYVANSGYCGAHLRAYMRDTSKPRLWQRTRSN